MNLFQKLKNGANKATDYAQQTIKTNKMNTQITSIKREIEQNNLQIGHAVYEAYKANDLSMAEEVIRLFSNNNLALEVEIVELEHEIEVVKNEKMCECGRKVSVDARFCSSCGKRFPYDPGVESAPEEEVVDVYRECKNCEMELAPDAKFCEKCGVIA
jgi:hypothetical protein